MDYDTYFEALYVINLVKLIDILQLTEADLTKIRKTTYWNKVFGLERTENETL